MRSSSTREYKTPKKTAGSLDIAKTARREPPGVQGQAGQPRSARGVHRRAVRESAARTTCSTTFYRALVQALFDAGVSRNVYCVNIDAVIAALLLKMLWKPLPRRRDSASATWRRPPSRSSCTRACSGCAAEIDDHLNRGRNMDTRTAASECRFVAWRTKRISPGSGLRARSHEHGRDRPRDVVDVARIQRRHADAAAVDRVDRKFLAQTAHLLRVRPE